MSVKALPDEAWLASMRKVCSRRPADEAWLALVCYQAWADVGVEAWPNEACMYELYLTRPGCRRSV